ncbi:unnamed protein product [Lactuca virosa]|uniref:Uncharacterized protein n=1 Tax=Lactuca virosa TaxID=75947 RepID=A0AAU9PSV6_9ASTR|nr:unnamed protein product [Lactuca virosa]
MALKLQQKKTKHQDPLDQVTIATDNDSESGDNRDEDFWAWLHDVVKEHHDLFIEQVTKMDESVDLQVAELKSEMEKIFIVFHSKVDVVVDAIAKLVEFNTAYSTKVEEKPEQDSKVSTKLVEFLSSIKETISKDDLSTH